MNSKVIASALLVAAFSRSPIIAQTFENGDLEGVAGSAVVPDGWTRVLFDDPQCEALGPGQDTPDCTDVNGPSYGVGLMGNPYSGNTFVSGAYSNGWHEGIWQSVPGFTVGCNYALTFHQSVCKQSSYPMLDSTGCWRVYIDDVLIGTTAPTFSAEPPISLNKPWEERTIVFMATATTLVFKFLPGDDDNVQSLPNGLRMGLDAISVVPFEGGAVGTFLGMDTALCSGNPVQLTAGIPGTEYLWSSGSSASSITVTEQGTYWLELTTTCGTASDTLTVLQSDPLTLDLGEDRIICPGDSLNFDLAVTEAIFQWQDGTISAAYTVSDSGAYWVQGTNACGSVTDTVHVAFFEPTAIDLGPDVIACSTEVVELRPNVGGLPVIWQDGSIAPSYSTTSSGDYWIEISLGCGTAQDTMHVSFVDSLAVHLEGELPCNGMPITLAAPDGALSYVWQDGSSMASLTTSQPGLYWVECTNACGMVTDSLDLMLIGPPSVDLGPDLTICGGQQIMLVATTPGATYIWSDGSTNALLVVTEPGFYSVLLHLDGCAASDSIRITADCVVELVLPNVFSPDASGQNDVFTPIWSRNIAEARVEIFDRWGVEVFSSTALDVRWDGKSAQGELLPEGVYYWVIHYRSLLQEEGRRTGSVTLLR